jgi:hypothetical protein
LLSALSRLLRLLARGLLTTLSTLLAALLILLAALILILVHENTPCILPTDIQRSAYTLRSSAALFL